MTFHVMAPTFDRAWTDGVRPLMDNQISEEEAFQRISTPFREFMMAQVRPKDLSMFADLAAAHQSRTKLAAAAIEPLSGSDAAASDEIDLRVLIPAFMVSELRRAFEIGFLIVLPFLVIDMVVGTLVMSMGMMMMPPVVLALPFKILFFILIDGWNLVIGGLVRSFF
jgi:flagellar biosynthetic protein FliP